MNVYCNEAVLYKKETKCKPRAVEHGKKFEIGTRNKKAGWGLKANLETKQRLKEKRNIEEEEEEVWKK